MSLIAKNDQKPCGLCDACCRESVFRQRQWLVIMQITQTGYFGIIFEDEWYRANVCHGYVGRLVEFAVTIGSKWWRLKFVPETTEEKGEEDHIVILYLWLHTLFVKERERLWEEKEKERFALRSPSCMGCTWIRAPMISSLELQPRKALSTHTKKGWEAEQILQFQ